MTDTAVVTEAPAPNATETVTLPAAETPPAPSTPAVDPAAPPAPAAAAEPAPVDERTRKGWEAVTKAEREVTRRKQEADRRERELAERAAKVEQVEKILASGDKVAAFKALGWSLDEIVQAHLKDGQPPTPDDRVTQLEKKLAEKEKAEAEKAERDRLAAEEAAKARTEETLKGFREGVAREVTAAGETYELVNAYGAHKLVSNVIEAHYRATAAEVQKGLRDKPEMLSVAQAAAMVEDHLEEQAKIGLATKKLSSRLAPPAPVATTPPAAPPAPRRASPTLTSTSTATPSAPPAPRGVPSREEGIAAAVKRMREGRKSA